MTSKGGTWNRRNLSVLCPWLWNFLKVMEMDKREKEEERKKHTRHPVTWPNASLPQLPSRDCDCPNLQKNKLRLTFHPELFPRLALFDPGESPAVLVLLSVALGPQTVAARVEESVPSVVLLITSTSVPTETLGHFSRNQVL